MTRMKKYVAATAVAAAVVGAPTMAQALSSPAKAQAKAPAAAPAAPAARTGASTPVKDAGAVARVRVVAPGERVQAAPGVRLWLTGDGKHWSTPDEAGQFRSVIDGNLDTSRPGITLQSEPVAGRYFLSGVYYGDVAGRAATVTVTTDRGTVTGRLVHLPGTPGWGAWYASAPLPAAKNKDTKHDFVHRVTVRDAGGDTLATLSLP
ncbi:hypothetical protein [Streptomyces sp. NPDC020917]|uniref:hypothetical protein n=1 Tax=Streptomyces sp. NPDC020917 TaxID=3365102 RepID=UPI0037A5B9CA